MPKITAATLAVTGLLLIALTGCSGEADDAAEPSTAPVPIESDAPLSAEESTPAAALGTDEAYLADIHAALEANGGSNIPNATDEQLVSAAKDACEQMLSGTDAFDVRVIEGEQPGETGFVDSLRIAGSAAKHYCPETAPED